MKYNKFVSLCIKQKLPTRERFVYVIFVTCCYHVQFCIKECKEVRSPENECRFAGRKKATGWLAHDKGQLIHAFYNLERGSVTCSG